MSFSTPTRVSQEVVGVWNGVSKVVFMLFINHISRFFSFSIIGSRAANNWRPHFSQLSNTSFLLRLATRISQQPQPSPENPGSSGQHYLDPFHRLSVWTRIWHCHNHGQRRHKTRTLWRRGELWRWLAGGDWQQHGHRWSFVPHWWQWYLPGLEAWMG